MELLILALGAIVVYGILTKNKNRGVPDEIQRTFNAAMDDIISVYVTTGQNILKIANSSEFSEDDNIPCHMQIMNELAAVLAAMRLAYDLNHIPGSMASFYVKAIGEKNFYYIHAANHYLIRELKKDNDRNHIFTTIENFSMRAAPNLHNVVPAPDNGIEKILTTSVSRQDATTISPDNVERGLLAVRAASYLMMLEDGEKPDAANSIVKRYDIDMDTLIILDAREFIKQRYNGKQLPMIAEARAKGFMK